MTYFIALLYICIYKHIIFQPIEWYDPSNRLVEGRSTKNVRVYVEKKGEDSGDMIPLIIHNIKITDSGNWTCKSGDNSDTIEFIVGG